MNSSGFIRQDFPLLRIPFFVYQWVVVVPFLGLSTFVIGGTIIILSFLGAPDFASRVLAKTWAKLNALVSMMKVTVKDRDQIDPGQSYVIVANHQSLVDIYVLYGFSGLNTKWVMKQELRSIPVFGLAAESMGHILIDRKNTVAAVASIENAREKISNGTSVVFFAEGTRSRTGELKSFKIGAFRLAQELGLPVLPVAIHGARDILAPDSLHLSPGRVMLEFCKPISTEGIGIDGIGELSQQARSAIQSALSS